MQAEIYVETKIVNYFFSLDFI